MRTLFLSILVLAFATTCPADTVTVELIGTVEYNQINNGVFGVVNSGDAVRAVFTVDSTNYIDSGSFGVRAYPIDMDSFSLMIGAAGPVALVDPQPDGATSYFCVRDADPVADGFFIANHTEWDNVVPSLDVPGQLDPYFDFRWSVGYTGDTLASLDIVEAVGSYDYTGLTNFYTALQDSWADAMGLEYGVITITVTVGNEDLTFGQLKNLYR